MSEESVNLLYLALKTRKRKLAKEAKQLLDSYNYILPLKAKVFYVLSTNILLKDFAYLSYRMLKRLKKSTK